MESGERTWSWARSTERKAEGPGDMGVASQWQPEWEESMATVVGNPAHMARSEPTVLKQTMMEVIVGILFSWPPEHVHILRFSVIAGINIPLKNIANQKP